LQDWIVRQGSTPSGHSAPVRLLHVGDLPLDVRVEHPERVGMDRLAAATAAARLRAPRRGAILVDSGSAITVDYVSADGAFRGGAILPGMGLAARALHEFTDLLPLVPLGELSAPPPALGTSTVTAIRSGLYWGAVGAVRELAERLSAGIDPQPELFLTGGAGPHLGKALSNPVRILPHLVLSGIALARRC
jgi:type III pantothenate kinase